MKTRKDRIFKGMEIIGDSLWGERGKTERINNPTIIHWLKNLFKLMGEELIGEPEVEPEIPATPEFAEKLFNGSQNENQ